MKMFVAGNWKMHGSLAQAADLIRQILKRTQDQTSSSVEAILCPPFVFLQYIATQLQTTHLKLGAQDVSAFEQGAYTGQISASMLKEMGCQYVIVGHSERRSLCHEQNGDIAHKAMQAQAHGLIPIICVGETRAEFEAHQTEQIVALQLHAVLESNKLNLNNIIIAYEPVWAIGTGLTATPEQAQNVHHLLRGVLARYDAQLAPKVPILYGGSVKPDNAANLFAQPDINGALVGGASLDASAFLAIVSAANQNLNKS